MPGAFGGGSGGGTSGLIATLIRDVVLPEIMAVVRAHHNAGLPPPTNEQVIAATQLDADRIVGIGEGFLASLPPVPPAEGTKQP